MLFKKQKTEEEITLEQIEEQVFTKFDKLKDNLYQIKEICDYNDKKPEFTHKLSLDNISIINEIEKLIF